MLFDHLHRITVQIVLDRRISDAVKTLVFMIPLFANLLIRFFNRNVIQRVHMFFRHPRLLRHLIFDIDGFRLQHPPGRRNADIRKRFSYCRFQARLYFGDRLRHGRYIVDLSVDHGTRLMLDGNLCHDDKTIRTNTVTKRTDDAPCANIQSKYVIFSLFSHNQTSSPVSHAKR